MRYLLDKHILIWAESDVTRMLLAQAMVEGLTLLTADSKLQQYGRFVRVVG